MRIQPGDVALKVFLLEPITLPIRQAVRIGAQTNGIQRKLQYRLKNAYTSENQPWQEIIAGGLPLDAESEKIKNDRERDVNPSTFGFENLNALPQE